MKRESRRDRGIQRVDATAGGEPADGAASAAHAAPHAFVLVAHDQDRRPRQIELADPLRRVGVQTDDQNSALTRGIEGTDQGRHPAQASMLDGAR